jgi:hypothetical protein
VVASFVQLNTGTGGLNAQTVSNTVGGTLVHANAVVLHDSAGNALSTLPVSVVSPARTPIVLSASGVTSVTAVALMTLNIYKGGTVTSATNYTVTLGKTFRIQAVQFGMRFITPSTTVTFASNTFALRFVTTGTVVVGSPILLQDSKLAASNAPTPNSDLTIPEGLDIPTNYNFGITHLASAATLAEDVIIVGYEY